MGSYNPDCHTGTKKKTFFLIMTNFFANILLVSFSVLVAEGSLSCKCTNVADVCKWKAFPGNTYEFDTCVKKDKTSYPCVIKEGTKITECYTLQGTATTTTATTTTTTTTTTPSTTQRRARRGAERVIDNNDKCKVEVCEDKTPGSSSTSKPTKSQSAVFGIYPLTFIVGLVLTQMMAPFFART